jgi:hypothetical protein
MAKKGQWKWKITKNKIKLCTFIIHALICNTLIKVIIMLPQVGKKNLICKAHPKYITNFKWDLFKQALSSSTHYVGLVHNDGIAHALLHRMVY